MPDAAEPGTVVIDRERSAAVGAAQRDGNLSGGTCRSGRVAQQVGDRPAKLDRIRLDEYPRAAGLHPKLPGIGRPFGLDRVADDLAQVEGLFLCRHVLPEQVPQQVAEPFGLLADVPQPHLHGPWDRGVAQRRLDQDEDIGDRLAHVMTYLTQAIEIVWNRSWLRREYLTADAPRIRDWRCFRAGTYWNADQSLGQVQSPRSPGTRPTSHCSRQATLA